MSVCAQLSCPGADLLAVLTIPNFPYGNVLPPAGALADRYGGKRVLAVGVAAWSVCTCLTPLASMLGIPALIGMRWVYASCC